MGLQSDGPGRAFGYDLPDDVLDGRHSVLVPVIIKAGELQLLGDLPVDELVRTGADGFGVEVVARIDQSLGLDGVAVTGEVIENCGAGAVGVEAYGVLIDDVGVSEGSGIDLDFRRLGRCFEGSYDVFSVHLGAVVELYALMKVEGPQISAVGLLGVLIALCEPGLRSQILIDLDELLIGQLIDVVACYCAVSAGADSGGLVCGADDDGVLIYCVMTICVVSCGSISAAASAICTSACC